MTDRHREPGARSFPRDVALAVVLLLAATTGEGRATGNPADRPNPERPDKALVYFCDGPNVSTPGRRWVFDLDRPLGFVDTGAVFKSATYFFAYLEPGPHWLWNRVPGSAVNYDGRNLYEFQAGQTYYLALAGGSNWVAPLLMPVDKRTSDGLVASAEFHALTDEELAKAREISEKHLAAAGPAPVPQTRSAASGVAGRVRVPSGKPIRLELLENANTHQSRVGQTLLVVVAQDVSLEGSVVVPKGLTLEAIIRRVAPPSDFGAPGFLEAEIPVLRHPDGTVVPLFGLLSVTAGLDAFGFAASSGVRFASSLASIASTAPVRYAGLAAGLLALPGMFVTGGDPWLLAGMQTTVYARAESWLPPAPPVRTPEASSGRVVAALSPAPVRVRPPSEALATMHRGTPLEGRVGDQWTVRLALDQAPREVWVEAVGDTLLPQLEGPSKVSRRKDGCELTFAAWSVLRWARLTDWESTIPVRLRGTAADGSDFTATAPVVFQVQGKKETSAPPPR